MVTPSILQLVALSIFVLALIHTFSTKFFENLAHKKPSHAGIFHLLGEVEVVFGFWAMILVVSMFFISGKTDTLAYLDSRNFTEPMFVFAVMVIAGSRPILYAVERLLIPIGKSLPFKGGIGFYLTFLIVAPLLGSLITEPAAMTLSALLLSTHFYSKNISNTFKYATLAILFVNISIGGTLTSFAAPPVLMVADTWNWNSLFMLTHFGWKSAIAVCINSILVTILFRKELSQFKLDIPVNQPEKSPHPLLIATHLFFLSCTVIFSHHPALFMGLFLFFLGVAQAYKHHQSTLILKEGLLVAFFLSGLVVIGGLQSWWLQPLLLSMSHKTIFLGAIGLTAITDNAALTYLGAQVPGLTDAFKYALVAGAVTGGGLTIIANAPNPAGVSILRRYFKDQTINPWTLFGYAFFPTLIAGLLFWFL